MRWPKEAATAIVVEWEQYVHTSRGAILAATHAHAWRIECIQCVNEWSDMKEEKT